MNAPDSSLQHRARMLYREAAQCIDPTTAGRLRAARRTALATAAVTPASRVMRMLHTGAAALALLVLMAWSPLLNRPGMPLPAGGMMASQIADADSDLPLDADKTDPTLYQNLEFYGWLATDSSHQVNQ
ncbi:hypothetical protein [Dyella tabacisoli]|uniref:DUF3619 family protein n=1 Tax=Dyella tabacisoli TaxID=2282381 RepID=A0A369UQW7_9GAMM|nr:hypothetical protein [Dyella tabacisoli]RDD83036.1 hypothetical protein DVJ77_04080 [Dyella tabacisoli]